MQPWDMDVFTSECLRALLKRPVCGRRKTSRLFQDIQVPAKDAGYDGAATGMYCNPNTDSPGAVHGEDGILDGTPEDSATVDLVMLGSLETELLPWISQHASTETEFLQFQIGWSEKGFTWKNQRFAEHLVKEMRILFEKQRS